MKIIFMMMTALISLNVMATEFKVHDVMCGPFDYYRSQTKCLVIIGDSFNQAGVLLDQKYVNSKVTDEKKLIGTNVSVNLNDLLMLTYEEEENVRNFINYQTASYYSLTPKNLSF
jgi:hypothetical protein